ncbi:hypothetical protein [Martelella limonii]|uniref:hypothetical protein n=1 Tax=Martelella limonii TaxID=1647649 RepID=UPI00157FECD2|nr:hypothetical protein [Martelella limonii]
MNTAIHTKIMQNAGSGKPFWFTDTGLMNAMEAGGWLRRSKQYRGLVELTDKAEEYAAKEKRWVKGRVA